MRALPQSNRHAPYPSASSETADALMEIMIAGKLSPGLETGQDPMDSPMLLRQMVLREKLL